LLGQQKNVRDAFAGPVYVLKAEGKTYVPERELKVPKYGNVFNILLADLNKSGNPMTLMIYPGWELRAYSSTGEELWASGVPYGASDKYVPMPPASRIDSPDTYDEIPVWLPTRLVLSQLTKDGRPEVVVVRNSERLGETMERLRAYYQGIIYSLYWNGLSMVENWRTPRISGYLTDYALADVGNLGRPALIMSVNQNMLDGFFEKGTGYVVAFTIKPQEKKKPKPPQPGL